MNEQGRLALEVSGSLLRGCYEAAQGVKALVEARQFGGLFAAERAAWEMWRELEYFFAAGDVGSSAVKAKANATIEVLEALSDDSDAPEDIRVENEKALAELESKFGTLVAEVREQRADRRFHWSGQRSRSAIVAAKGTPFHRVYKMLSWEAHPQLCFIREISTEEVGNRTFLRFETSEADRAFERAAWAVSEYLQRAWNQFAAGWGQTQIDFPLSKAP